MADVHESKAHSMACVGETPNYSTLSEIATFAFSARLIDAPVERAGRALSLL